MASGLLGRDLDTAAGKEAAKFCAINILAQAKAALGDLEKIRRLVKITVFVASTPDFTEQHLVANGASDFLVAALGERGKHARSAVGIGVAAAQRAGRNRSDHRSRLSVAMTDIAWITKRPIAHRGYHDLNKTGWENTLSAFAARRREKLSRSNATCICPPTACR